jgi:hypothetical protein
MDRREYLKLIGVGAVGATLPGCAPSEVEATLETTAAREPDGTFRNYAFRYFTEPEVQTVRILVDMIIPADGRSGSATDARVPEFIDFTAWDRESLRVPLRGGLAWLNSACLKSYQASFADCTDAQRRAMLERIAWPDVASDLDAPGVTFFNLIRDMTASGFFSSEMGVKDLGYMGNVAMPSWTGCQDPA